MDARRSVRAAKDDVEKLARVRSRVNDAKVALGERGEPWWLDPTEQGTQERAAATIRALLAKRGPMSSICPSEVARIIASPDWRPVMDSVRRVAAVMAELDVIDVTRSGERIEDPAADGGPVRYALRVDE